MKRGDAFPSRYLGKGDVDQPVSVRIQDVTLEHMPGAADDEFKPVIAFQGDVKAFICNQTNWSIIEDAYGAETLDWRGKAVEIYHDPDIRFGNKRVGGLRVRIPGGADKPTQSAATTEGAVKRSFLAALKDFSLTEPDPQTEEGRTHIAEQWGAFVAANGDIAGDWPRLAERIKAFFDDEDIPF